jgi:hypothetical protein
MVEGNVSSDLSLGIASTPSVKPVGGNSGKENAAGDPRHNGRSRKKTEDEGDASEFPEIPPLQIDKLA